MKLESFGENGFGWKQSITSRLGINDYMIELFFIYRILPHSIRIEMR